MLAGDQGHSQRSQLRNQVIEILGYNTIPNSLPKIKPHRVFLEICDCIPTYLIDVSAPTTCTEWL
jgi:hypothetical protein